MDVYVSIYREISLTINVRPFHREGTERIRQISSRRWMRRNESRRCHLLSFVREWKTVKAYGGQVVRLIAYLHENHIRWSDHTVRDFTLYLLEKFCSHAYVNQVISAIKFYLTHVIGYRDLRG